MAKLMYERDMLDLYADPTDFFKKCLYLKETESEQICTYLGTKIDLSNIPFKALFKMAADTTRYHLFTTDRKEVNYIPDADRKIINRIKNKFKEAGFSADFIKSKKSFGYKIDTEIIPDSFVITTKK